MTLRRLALAVIAATAFAGAAQAATCAGVPAADVTEFRGPVLDVIDGERLCVALGATPGDWVAVRLADAPMQVSTAPASRGALMAASFGQDVTCRIVGRDEDMLIAECRSDRGSIGRLSQTRKIVDAGQNWR